MRGVAAGDGPGAAVPACAAAAWGGAVATPAAGPVRVPLAPWVPG